jgi:hypothetical protein
MSATSNRSEDGCTVGARPITPSIRSDTRCGRGEGRNSSGRSARLHEVVVQSSPSIVFPPSAPSLPWLDAAAMSAVVHVGTPQQTENQVAAS